MQATEAVRSEAHIDLSIRENRSREMQDVVSRYLPRFYRSAYRQLGNTADAEDAVQDALLSAHKCLDQFRGEAQMSTWLATIVINCARMQLRRRSRHPHVSLDEPTGDGQEYYWLERLAWSGPSPEDECRKSELHMRLMECVEQLSPSLRRAFQLSDFEGLALREVAHTLGVAEGTVKAQVSRARAKLSRLMVRSLRGKSRSLLSRNALPSRGRSKQSRQNPASGGRCASSG